MSSSILVVGHYCHDVLIHSNGSRSKALGGSVAYISSALAALGEECEVVSKVGADFAYLSSILHRPTVSQGFETTQFIADFTSGERTMKVGAICEPIEAGNIPEDQSFAFGIAAGVIGEVTPEAFRKMIYKSQTLICDVQGLIRVPGSQGEIEYKRLEETPYFPILNRVTYLKTSRQEASALDLDQLRKMTCLLVTEGAGGCTVYEGDKEFRVPSFSVTEVDPTGAGDCFVAGLVTGLKRGWQLERAVRLGNYLGSLAVTQVGVPVLTSLKIPDSI